MEKARKGMYRVVETACPARPQLPAAPGATSRLAHAPFIRNMSSVIALLLEFQVFLETFKMRMYEAR